MFEGGSFNENMHAQTRTQKPSRPDGNSEALFSYFCFSLAGIETENQSLTFQSTSIKLKQSGTDCLVLLQVKSCYSVAKHSNTTNQTLLVHQVLPEIFSSVKTITKEANICNKMESRLCHFCFFSNHISKECNKLGRV